MGLKWVCKSKDRKIFSFIVYKYYVCFENERIKCLCCVPDSLSAIIYINKLFKGKQEPLGCACLGTFDNENIKTHREENQCISTGIPEEAMKHLLINVAKYPVHDSLKLLQACLQIDACKYFASWGFTDKYACLDSWNLFI